MTYSCMRMHTTIGAVAFHFRVRDGIGWFHSAMFARERVEGRVVSDELDGSRSRSRRGDVTSGLMRSVVTIIEADRDDFGLYGQATRIISIS